MLKPTSLENTSQLRERLRERTSHKKEETAHIILHVAKSYALNLKCSM